MDRMIEKLGRIGGWALIVWALLGLFASMTASPELVESCGGYPHLLETTFWTLITGFGLLWIAKTARDN